MRRRITYRCRLTVYRISILNAACEHLQNVDDAERIILIWKRSNQEPDIQLTHIAYCVQKFLPLAQTFDDWISIAFYYSDLRYRYGAQMADKERYGILRAEVLAESTSDWLECARAWFRSDNSDKEILATRCIRAAETAAITATDYANLACECALYYENLDAGATMLSRAKLLSQTPEDEEAMTVPREYIEASRSSSDKPLLPFNIRLGRISYCPTKVE
jgi:hypothetical protein